MKNIVINGKFLSQRITGVQRYAREIIGELDKIITKDMNVILAVDSTADDIPEYKNIQIKRIGRYNGNLWEQISLPLFVKKEKAVCVSLCNMTPILTPDIVVIHDISYKVNPQFFSKKFSLWYKLVFALTIRRIKHILTVSEFSKNEIINNYPVDRNIITVTYNGWQHYSEVGYSEYALDKYGLSKGEFFFSMSSMAPNKNFKWIAEAARNNPDDIFAVSGSVNNKVFGDIFDFEVPDNLKFLGYVSDEEAKTLMRDCKAFLFPTFYEGFGIPPLEAMSVGAKAIVSDASCMREVFEDSVYYVDPYNPNVDLDKLISESVADSSKILDKYSWNKSAKLLLRVINND